jgi:DNA-binding response OmpR family regulator
MEINGYSADIEVSGDSGLRIALSGDYDLVILDVMLPKVDGFEICRQLRAVKDIPILMVSARKEDIDKIRGLGLGADDYIIKPFSPGELVARVKAHLARYERLRVNSEPKNEEIRIRGLHIDKTSHRVYINNLEVSFTAKEFDLLVLLASNPNRVFSKAELFERLWGLDSVGDIATVTVHIGKLREKIELVPSNPQYIETIWGVGYRFKM